MNTIFPLKVKSLLTLKTHPVPIALFIHVKRQILIRQQVSKRHSSSDLVILSTTPPLFLTCVAAHKTDCHLPKASTNSTPVSAPKVSEVHTCLCANATRVPMRLVELFGDRRWTVDPNRGPRIEGWIPVAFGAAPLCAWHMRGRCSTGSAYLYRG